MLILLIDFSAGCVGIGKHSKLNHNNERQITDRR